MDDSGKALDSLGDERRVMTLACQTRVPAERHLEGVERKAVAGTPVIDDQQSPIELRVVNVVTNEYVAGGVDLLMRILRICPSHK